MNFRNTLFPQSKFDFKRCWYFAPRIFLLVFMYVEFNLELGIFVISSFLACAIKCFYRDDSLIANLLVLDVHLVNNMTLDSIQ